MGPLCKKEVKTLSGIVKRSAAPFVLIIGGSKISDKLDVIKNLLPKVDHILLGGGAALTFQKAQGMDIKDSISEDSMIPHIKDLLADNKIVLPIDELWEQDRILDIGPATVSHYEAIIKTAKTIVWAGPMGLYENSQFANGSKKIAKAIAASNAFSVIGGGDTTKILTNMDIEKEISFVSTGGGAMLELLAGKELPAIQALIDQKK
jgi:phosphoglycerate kinase